MSTAALEIRYKRGKAFDEINMALSAKLVGLAGSALIPVSGVSALLPGDLRKILLAQMSDSQLAALVKAKGGTVAGPVDEKRFASLIQFREPEDTPARTIPAKPGWHLACIEAPGAWALLGGPDSIDWGGVLVGHLDTGYTENLALGFKSGNPSSLWVDTLRDHNFRRNDTGGDSSEPPREDPNSAYEFALWGTPFSGHGTRTMSTLCGYDPAAPYVGGKSKGFYGVAPQVPTVPVRVTDFVGITDILDSALPEAIRYLVNDVGVNVMSMSLGAPHFLTIKGIPKSLKAAINEAYEKGVIYICAAGNDVPNPYVIYPARSNRTLAVAGVALKDGKVLPWTGSSCGAQVDISAPAHNILRPSTSRSNKFTYGDEGDGTSYATAMTAGAAALWLAKHGSALDKAYPEQWMRVEAFKQSVMATATPHANPASKAEFGAGVLNVKNLLKAKLPAIEVLMKDAEA